MKKILSGLIILVISAIFVSTDAAASTISQNDQKQEKQEKKKKVKRLIVSGIVTDEQGNPLDDVVVLPVSESNSEPPAGVMTRNGGKYSIIINSDRILMFALTGYESKKVEIKGKDEIDITMKKIPEKK
jgi:hypothetical protein